MADYSDKLEEIKTLLSSSSKENKPSAYSSFLQLQEQSNADSYIQTLSQSSDAILHSIMDDICNDGEEIAALALKCLGFMVYHPVLVAAITVVDADSIIESLAELITTTKIKSICNLGVWCISIQQFPVYILGTHFSSLLRAVVHALDNPIGSLSTTFEAIQAVMKLETQLNMKMRYSSNIWTPPIYRRLISTDKMERDISERCMLKTRSSILPSLPQLSKVVVLDIKQKLLHGMNELLLNGMKVQAMQAWGWFIRLLGSHAMKYRNLVNEMLRIPEKAFSDHDPQFQTAALVAWEGLIDALIDPPIQSIEENILVENGVQNKGKSEIDKYMKSIKLIMTPLVGIMSSKCDVSVHSACLNTWCYLLHKLDLSVTNPLIIKTVLEPILEAVFYTKLTNKSLWSWKLCTDLLCDFISTNNENANYSSNDQAINPISLKSYSVKWLPWDISHLDFHMKMITILINQGVTNVFSDYKSYAFDAALSLFRSVLKGIQIVFKSSSITYDESMLCLNKVLQFVKKICEDVTLQGHIPLRFLEAVVEELELHILGSPLYNLALDIKYINKSQSVNEIKYVKLLQISSIMYMDMVSPLVYLTVLYMSVVLQSNLYALKLDLVPEEMQNYLKIVVSSCDSLRILQLVIGLLYKHIGFNSLKIWITSSEVIKGYIECVKDLAPLKELLCHFLTYPFIVYSSCSGKELTAVDDCGSPNLSLVFSLRELELDHVIEVWKSLYRSITHASYFDSSFIDICTENLCLMLNVCFGEDTTLLECGSEVGSGSENWNRDLFVLVGNLVIFVLEQIPILEIRAKENKYNGGRDCNGSRSINAAIRFSSRFMRLSWLKNKLDPLGALPLQSRVVSALRRFLGCLYLKQDILLSFIEILSRPLLQQLSCMEEQDENTISELQLLWTETLNSLRRTEPPIIFDSSFLKLQSPLLEKTLDQPNPSVSSPAIHFYNSTYSQQATLDHPQSLLHVLDKVLSRTGKINLGKCNSRPEYKVSATQNMVSKRVELIENNELSFPSMKRKRLELTEHQKEVRRAQQGKERDCSGHGPGVRTYTSVDFSQGDDESQDSEDIRNPESILEMLKRTRIVKYDADLPTPTLL